MLPLAGRAGRYFHHGPAPPQHRLAHWPFREHWARIVSNDEKMGYAHLAVRRALDQPEMYEITADSDLAPPVACIGTTRIDVLAVR